MKQILLIAVFIILFSVVECVEITKNDSSEQEQWGKSQLTVKSRLLKKSAATNQTQSAQENQQNNIQENKVENEQETNQANKVENEQETNQINEVENEQEIQDSAHPIHNIIDDIKEDINTVQDYLGDLPIKTDDLNALVNNAKNFYGINQQNQNAQTNGISMQKDTNQAEQQFQQNDIILDDENEKLNIQADNFQNLEDTYQAEQSVQANDRTKEDSEQIVQNTDYSQNNNEFVLPIVVIFENLRQDIEKIESYFADIKTNQNDQKDYANDAKALEIIDIVFQDTSYGQELEDFGQSFQQLLINIGNVHNQFEQYAQETQGLKLKLEDLNQRLDFEQQQEKATTDEFLQSKSEQN